MADRRGPKVLLIAEQLRRAVPGGIGVYVGGMLSGFTAMGSEAPDATLWASRAPRGLPDLVASLGRLATSRLPGPAMVKAWDLGLGRPRFEGGDSAVTHASSLAAPPADRRLGGPVLSVMVHDLAWKTVPDAYPARGRRWHEAALGRAIDRAGGGRQLHHRVGRLRAIARRGGGLRSARCGSGAVAGRRRGQPAVDLDAGEGRRYRLRSRRPGLAAHG